MKKREIFIIPLVITAIISVFLDYSYMNVWDVVLRLGVIYAIGFMIMMFIWWDNKGDVKYRTECCERLCGFRAILMQIDADPNMVDINFVKGIMGDDMRFVSLNGNSSHYKVEDSYNRYDFYFNNNGKLYNYCWDKCKDMLTY